MNDGHQQPHSFDEIADCIDLLTLADEEPPKAYTAWIEIARRFAEGEVESAGLCWALRCACWGLEGVEQTLDIPTFNGMEAQVKSYLDAEEGQQYAYALKSDRWECVKEDEARCLAAIWLGMEAEEAADLAADEVTNG